MRSQKILWDKSQKQVIIENIMGQESEIGDQNFFSWDKSQKQIKIEIIQ